MNRSTPINNLPQGSFVNEQQRQIVMQAQQAITNMQLPQNTQLTPVSQNFDISNEDDVAIQEVLNQIQATTSSPPSNSDQMPIHATQMQSIPTMPPQPTAYQTQQTQHTQQTQQADQAMAYMGQFPPQPQQYIDPNMFSNRLAEQNSMLHSITAVAQDVKLATFVFILFIIVQLVPADKFLVRYIAIDKIPYYHIIVKALIAFVAVIVFKKFLS
jgi:hypothetical protein